ncbi:cytochrome b5 domain-containing protein [Candidatus Woesearchaeota archaeon]|nr:cytochrome b5 domain-containing protein [Candidatus Woesearchaeota archaeon]
MKIIRALPIFLIVAMAVFLLGCASNDANNVQVTDTADQDSMVDNQPSQDDQQAAAEPDTNPAAMEDNTDATDTIDANAADDTANDGEYTLEEVAMHATEDDCWTTVDGFVYDLTPFVSQHPGGERNIMKICGIDGSAAFDRKHGGQTRPENELAGLEIGVLGD